MAKMKVVELDNFDEFVRRHPNDFVINRSRIPQLSYRSELLFRGQSNADWNLTTTLERHGICNCAVSDYVNFVARALPEYASYMKRYNQLLVNAPEYPTWQSVATSQTLFNLLIELRHFGFPSPLLDWTTSPYVAAYFAFRDAKSKQSAAIFAMQEWAGHGKGGIASKPKITGIGPYVEATDRHHIQQAQYTVCTQGDDTFDAFAKHDDGFNESYDTQDIVVKYAFPPDIRDPILRQLHLMNINEYTLFRSPEALCKYLGQRHVRRHPDS